jgi:hypothetical protein
MQVCAEMIRLLDEGWDLDRELNRGGKFIPKKYFWETLGVF